MLDALCRAEVAFEIKRRGERVHWVASGYAGRIGEAIDALTKAVQKGSTSLRIEPFKARV